MHVLNYDCQASRMWSLVYGISRYTHICTVLEHIVENYRVFRFQQPLWVVNAWRIWLYGFAVRHSVAIMMTESIQIHNIIPIASSAWIHLILSVTLQTHSLSIVKGLSLKDIYWALLENIDRPLLKNIDWLNWKVWIAIRCCRPHWDNLLVFLPMCCLELRRRIWPGNDTMIWVLKNWGSWFECLNWGRSCTSMCINSPD